VDPSVVGRWTEALTLWTRTNRMVLAWSFGLSLLLFAGSLVVMPILLARMRADYFLTTDPAEHTWLGRHPAARLAARVLRNTLGAVLLLAGLAMMVLPGQGIITILVALSLLEFPGKRRLELRLVRQPQVRAAIDWIRRRAGSPPLRLPDDAPPD